MIMKRNIVILLLGMMISATVSAQRHGCCREKPSHHFAGAKERYNKCRDCVYYHDNRIKGAHAKSFKDLGYGYARDKFGVYYKGVRMKGVSVNSFRVLKSGYARDNFDAYYKGRRIKGASVSSFRVLKDGYAKDNFNVYYRGVRKR